MQPKTPEHTLHRSTHPATPGEPFDRRLAAMSFVRPGGRATPSREIDRAVAALRDYVERAARQSPGDLC